MAHILYIVSLSFYFFPLAHHLSLTDFFFLLTFCISLSIFFSSFSAHRSLFALFPAIMLFHYGWFRWKRHIGVQQLGCRSPVMKCTFCPLLHAASIGMKSDRLITISTEEEQHTFSSQKQHRSLQISFFYRTFSAFMPRSVYGVI